jgi:hypothetical protein
MLPAVPIGFVSPTMSATTTSVCSKGQCTGNKEGPILHHAWGLHSRDTFRIRETAWAGDLGDSFIPQEGSRHGAGEWPLVVTTTPPNEAS